MSRYHTLILTAKLPFESVLTQQRLLLCNNKLHRYLISQMHCTIIVCALLCMTGV